MKTLIALIGFAISAPFAGHASQDLSNPDSGTFDYYIHKDKVGTSSYNFLPGGILTSTFELASTDININGQVKIEFRGQDNWEKVSYEVNGNQIYITNNDSELLFSIGGQEQSIPNESQGNLLEDMSPILLQNILLRYAKRTAGTQSFDAFFIPAMNIKGEIEYLESREIVIQKKSAKY